MRNLRRQRDLAGRRAQSTMPEITIRGIDGGCDQVLRGKHDGELLQKAQENATKKICQQQKRIA